MTNQDLLAANEELQEENLRLKARLHEASAVKASATVAKQATAEAEKKLLWWKESCDQIERDHEQVSGQMGVDSAKAMALLLLGNQGNVCRVGKGPKDAPDVHSSSSGAAASKQIYNVACIRQRVV